MTKLPLYIIAICALLYTFSFERSYDNTGYIIYIGSHAYFIEKGTTK